MRGGVEGVSGVGTPGGVYRVGSELRRAVQWWQLHQGTGPLLTSRRRRGGAAGDALVIRSAVGRGITDGALGTDGTVAEVGEGETLGKGLSTDNGRGGTMAALATGRSTHPAGPVAIECGCNVCKPSLTGKGWGVGKKVSPKMLHLILTEQNMSQASGHKARKRGQARPLGH